MREKQIFFNPFRIISPKLDAEASRLAEIFESPPQDITCLEEGLLVMISKLIEMNRLLRKCLIIYDTVKAEKCENLAREIHDEEKKLTGDIVCSPTTTGAILKALVLFPGRLERVGDLLESILNVARIKSRDAIPFSDKANTELNELFDLMNDMLKNFRDLIATRNRDLLDHVRAEQKKIGQLTIDFGLAHEDRLLGGLCTPKASSLYLDVLDSIKSANQNVSALTESLAQLAESGQAAAGNN
jgi:Na+/phosphate symporter